MSWKSKLGGFMDPLGLAGFNKNENSKNYAAGMANAAGGLPGKFKKAGKELTAGYDKAIASAGKGFTEARATTDSGYDTARGELNTGYDTANKTAREGYKEAQARYETPEMVGTRQELFNRVLGKGGMSDETLEMQKAKSREEYGTGLRSTADSLSSQFGDSTSEGMAGENLARAANALGAERANAVRDIDIGNERMKREEMTGAMGSLQAEAGARAGLSAQEAEWVSGLEARFADSASNLTAQETNALSQLAAAEGTTLADLQARLASGQASLTTEEAKALAEIATAAATGAATIAAGKSGMLV